MKYRIESPSTVWRDFLHFNCIRSRLTVFFPRLFAVGIFYCARWEWKGIKGCTFYLFFCFFFAFSIIYNNPWRFVCVALAAKWGCIGSDEVELWQFLGISCCCRCCAGVWVAAMGQSIKVFGAFKEEFAFTERPYHWQLGPSTWRSTTPFFLLNIICNSRFVSVGVPHAGGGEGLWEHRSSPCKSSAVGFFFTLVASAHL